jgi:hypothetical protein
MDPATGFDPNDPEFQAWQRQKAQDQAAQSYQAPIPPAPVNPIAQALTPPAPSPLDQSPPTAQERTGVPAARPAPRGNPLQALDDANTYSAQQSAAAAQAAASMGPEVKETYQKPTKNEAALNKKLDTATQAETAAVGKASDAKIAAAKAEVGGAESEQEQINLAQADDAVIRHRARAEYDAGQKELDQQRQKIIADGGKSYWEDKGTAAHVASALMAGIGQFAAALTGGPNAALDTINRAIDRDAAMKRETTQRKLEALGIKGAQLDKHMAMAETEIANNKSALLESLAAARGVRLAQNNVGGAEAEKDVLKAGLDRRAAAERLQAEEKLRHVISIDSNGPRQQAAQAKLAQLSTGQDKAVGSKDVNDNERSKDNFLGRAMGEAKRLADPKLPAYSDRDYREIERWRAKVSEIGDTTPGKFFGNLSAINGDIRKRLSPEGRARFDAEQGWAEAILRPDSGAAINAGEYVSKVGGIQAGPRENGDQRRARSDRMLEQMAGVATQTFRPRYWGEKLHEIGGIPNKLSPGEIATLVKRLRDNPNDPRADEIRQVLSTQAR